MPEEEAASVRVFSGLVLDKEAVKLKSGLSKIFLAGSFECKDSVKQIVGGDSPELAGAADAPAIIIEKDGDRIGKIIVRCPCGRHSELLCEYEEGV